jgi:hypothetical protein
MNVNGSVRDMFPEPYTGLDMRAGAGVDVVADFMDGYRPNEYMTVVSTDTLEHTLEPWMIIGQMSRCLKQGGRTYISVPWMFAMHDYPEDCWRILPTAMRHLLDRSNLEAVIVDSDESHTFAVAVKR